MQYIITKEGLAELDKYFIEHKDSIIKFAWKNFKDKEIRLYDAQSEFDIEKRLELTALRDGGTSGLSDYLLIRDIRKSDMRNSQDKMLDELKEFVGDWHNETHPNTSECYIDKGAMREKIEELRGRVIKVLND
jgi:hypothetical protein